MKAYETVFILTPVLSEAQMQQSINKYISWLKKNGGDIVHQESIGLKNLSYPIAGKTLGFYYLIEFQAQALIIQHLETAYKRDERVLRYLIVRLDKHAEAYNEKRRQKLQERAAASSSEAKTEKAKETNHKPEDKADTAKDKNEPENTHNKIKS